MNYVLKRKDEIITIINFADDGSIYKFQQDMINPEYTTLYAQWLITGKPRKKLDYIKWRAWVDKWKP